MHAVIVGNGILGLTAAFRLARASSTDEVTIVGDPRRPGSATLAAGAMLNSFAEAGAHGLETDVELFHFELSHLATRSWPRLILDIIGVAGSRLPAGCASCTGPCGGCYDTGTYVVNNASHDAQDDAHFDGILAALERFDEPHRHVNPRDIPGYAPETRHRATRAVFIPGEAWLNPRLAVDALEAALGALPNVKRVDARVDRLSHQGGAVDGVVLADGTRVHGDRTVLAAGSSSGELLRRSGLDVRMQRLFHGVGVSLELRSAAHPLAKTVRTTTRGLSHGLYAVPYFVSPDQPRDRVLVGASNHVMAVPRDVPTLSTVETLSRTAIEQVQRGWEDAEVLRVNVGWRPTSQDTYPLVGATSVPNLVVVTGTKRDGFHLAPVLSQHVAALVRGEPVDERMRVFAPERPLIRELTRAQAIDRALRNKATEAHQRGFAPSRGGIPAAVMDAWRDELERLHDRVGAHDWGLHPEMLAVYRSGDAVADGSWPVDAAH